MGKHTKKGETKMKKLNKTQVTQLEELENVTSKEFADLMLKYTRLVSSEQLDSLYNESIELEELEEYTHCKFDVNYYSVAADYAMLDNDTIMQAFGFYGEFNLYMDELGRGLVVEYY